MGRYLKSEKVTQQMLNDFQMPEISQGSPVVWYRRGIRNRRDMELGFVSSVSDRTIAVWATNSGAMPSVRHVDDPKLKLNADHREYGAWDYTDAHIEMMERFDVIESKLSAVNCGKVKPKVDGGKAEPSAKVPVNGVSSVAVDPPSNDFSGDEQPWMKVRAMWDAWKELAPMYAHRSDSLAVLHRMRKLAQECNVPTSNKWKIADYHDALNTFVEQLKTSQLAQE